MASEAKIKLLISSALKDAGLKASTAQIDRMAESMARANKSGSKDAEKLAAAIGKIGGPLEEIGKAAGGGFGKFMMLVGAFKVGYEIGDKIGDMLAAICPAYDRFKNGADEAERAQRRLNRSLEESAKAFDRSMEAAARSYDSGIKSADAVVRHVTQIAESYRAAQKAKEEFENASGDVEMQRLKREKFEDVAILQRAGDFEAADQVSAAYDVLEAEMTAKRQIEAFDRESAALAEERARKEEAVCKAAERKVKAAEKSLRMAEKESEKLESSAFNTEDGTWTMKPEEYERRSKVIDGAVEKAKLALADAKSNADSVRAKMGVASADEITRGIRRAELQDRVLLDADRARLAYDNLTEANGNAAGLSWSADYAQKVYDESVQSHRTLVDVERNTADLAAKIDELLSIKGG